MIVTVDAAQFVRLSNMLGAAGDGARHAIRRALNHTGDKARTQMVRALTTQTGLKRQVIVRALHATRAAHGGPLDGLGSGALSYAINSKGGDVKLQHFNARETKAGVSAAPHGKRQVFGGTFIKGGRFPNRKKAAGLWGHVWERAGKSRTPLSLVKSGVIIPQEMVEGQTRAAFFAVVDRDLMARLEHELLRVLR